MSKTKKKKPLDRFKVIAIVMLIVILAIILRLIYLQVVKHEDYKEKANTRARRFISEQAPRGKIYDSNGTILATNKETYTLTFTETDKSKEQFYNTIDKVHKMLEERGEKFQDKFLLRLNEKNEFYFDFNTTNEEDRKRAELRFKKDRGLGEQVKKKLFPKKEGDLTAEESEEIDDALLKISPYETFQYLVKLYDMYMVLKPSEEQAKAYFKLNAQDMTDLILKKYSLQDIRRYMSVKDAIKIQSFQGAKPVTMASDINQETAFIFYQKLNDLPGIDVAQTPIRYYPYNNLGSAVLGYVSSINSDNKEKYEARGYDVSTDSIGRAGIEAAFESQLKGSKGGTTVTVNSAGRKQDELFSLETSPGKDVHLTIDKDIQHSAEESLKKQIEYLQKMTPTDVDTRRASRGAAVAIEVKTGRVLALASFPTFDPNMFTHGELSPEVSKQYFSPDLESWGNEFIKKWGLKATIDELFPKNKYGQRDDKYDLYPKPFYNYATMGLIPPGSTFKPMTAVVGLEEGVINPSTTVPAGMYYDLHPEIYGKPNAHGTHGPLDNNASGNVDLASALKRSSNSFFYDLAVQLCFKYSNNRVEALDSIAKYAWKFGLGVAPHSDQKAGTGIEIAENFGNTFNFDSFKKQNMYYSKFKLVNFLENGEIPNRGKFPAVVGIGENPRDDKNLAKAKTELKKVVTDKINEIGTKDINMDAEAFANNIKDALQNLYDVSPSYKKSIEEYIATKDSKMTVDKALATTANSISNWILYDVFMEITARAQLGYAAIGQGTSAYSPVQIANYVATLVNGGTRYKVHLVDKVTDPEGNVVEEFKPEIMEETNIDPKNIEAIKAGMYKVNHDSSTAYGGTGTAYRIFGNFPIKTGGKTGTATFSSNQKEFGREAYGVYIGFAPLDNPEIAVAVVIYDGGHGNLAAPVAKAIFETYFRDELKSKYPGYKPAYDFTLNPNLDKQNQDKDNQENKDNNQEKDNKTQKK